MKISEYPLALSVNGSDYLLIVTNTNSDPANKKIKVSDFFSTNKSNTSIQGNFTANGNVNISGNNYNVTSTNVTFTNLTVNNFRVNSNGFVISSKLTPANSSILEAGSQGKISWDDDYLYIKTANNVTKRITLQSF